MKRPSPLLQRGTQADMNVTMTPMIDVVFLLLVFFVWTASFQIIEQILPSQMSAQMGGDPVAHIEPPPEADFDNVIVRIGWDGESPHWKINDESIASLQQVSTHLQAIAAVKIDAPVILHPDPEVPLGPVIEVYDAAKLAGFAKISFAVNPAK